jgi:acetylornithine deacetylase/succinyl-diaminopimelate desuccinylase-like protein
MRVVFLALSICTLTAVGLISGNDNTRIRAYRQANEQRIFQEFVTFLSIPNVASDPAHLRANTDFILMMMKQRGLNPRLLEDVGTNAPPAVFGEWQVSGARQTILFYAHYDGQPTDPKQWTGSLPWKPLLRSASLEAGGREMPMPGPGVKIDPNWRLYARSASDDKAGVLAILTAVDALKANGLIPACNIKFLFEGEEEAGSPHLANIITSNRELLAADAWLMCDGPVHQSGLKQVVFGVRGDVNVDLTVYGPLRPLHSGHYGNWAPNPALTLARLLASMKDDSGRVTIAGWYDDVEPLGQDEIRAINEAPPFDDQLRAQLGIARSDGGQKSLMQLINEPSLNINGFGSGDIGTLARNVIPTTASAVLDLRLVKGNDYRRQIERLFAHIRKQGFYVIDREPTIPERRTNPLIARVNSRAGGYNAERTKMDLPISRSVVRALQSTTDEPIVILPTSGGSLPLSIITANVKTVTISVPIANYDNNQHAENENIRLQNLWDGIETMAALLMMKVDQ